MIERRRRAGLLLATVREADPEAFVSLDPVRTAMGAYLPHVAGPASVRK